MGFGARGAGSTSAPDNFQPPPPPGGCGGVLKLLEGGRFRLAESGVSDWDLQERKAAKLASAERLIKS